MITPTIKTEKGVALKDHEVLNRMAPGGRLPIKGAKNTVTGEPKGTVISDASPAAVAAMRERHDVRHKPDLVAKRQRGN